MHASSTTQMSMPVTSGMTSQSPPASTTTPPESTTTPATTQPRQSQSTIPQAPPTQSPEESIPTTSSTTQHAEHQLPNAKNDPSSLDWQTEMKPYMARMWTNWWSPTEINAPAVLDQEDLHQDPNQNQRPRFLRHLGESFRSAHPKPPNQHELQRNTTKQQEEGGEEEPDPLTLVSTKELEERLRYLTGFSGQVAELKLESLNIQVLRGVMGAMWIGVLVTFFTALFQSIFSGILLNDQSNIFSNSSTNADAFRSIALALYGFEGVTRTIGCTLLTFVALVFPQRIFFDARRRGQIPKRERVFISLLAIMYAITPLFSIYGLVWFWNNFIEAESMNYVEAELMLPQIFSTLTDDTALFSTDVVFTGVVMGLTYFSWGSIVAYQGNVDLEAMLPVTAVASKLEESEREEEQEQNGGEEIDETDGNVRVDSCFTIARVRWREFRETVFTPILSGLAYFGKATPVSFILLTASYLATYIAAGMSLDFTPSQVPLVGIITVIRTCAYNATEIFPFSTEVLDGNFTIALTLNSPIKLSQTCNPANRIVFLRAVLQSVLVGLEATIMYRLAMITRRTAWNLAQVPYAKSRARQLGFRFFRTTSAISWTTIILSSILLTSIPPLDIWMFRDMIIDIVEQSGNSTSNLYPIIGQNSSTALINAGRNSPGNYNASVTLPPTPFNTNNSGNFTYFVAVNITYDPLFVSGISVLSIGFGNFLMNVGVWVLIAAFCYLPVDSVRFLGWFWSNPHASASDDKIEYLLYLPTEARLAEVMDVLREIHRRKRESARERARRRVRAALEQQRHHQAQQRLPRRVSGPAGNVTFFDGGGTGNAKGMYSVRPPTNNDDAQTSPTIPILPFDGGGGGGGRSGGGGPDVSQGHHYTRQIHSSPSALARHSLIPESTPEANNVENSKALLDPTALTGFKSPEFALAFNLNANPGVTGNGRPYDHGHHASSSQPSDSNAVATSLPTTFFSQLVPLLRRKRALSGNHSNAQPSSQVQSDEGDTRLPSSLRALMGVQSPIRAQVATGAMVLETEILLHQVMQVAYLATAYNTLEGRPLSWEEKQELIDDPSLHLVAHVEDEVTDTHAVIIQGEDRVIIGFRGTQSLRNVRTDYDSKGVVVPFAVDVEPLLTPPFTHRATDKSARPPHAHRGMLASYDSVRERIESHVRDFFAIHPSGAVFTTGHSLGAGLAILCSLHLAVTLKLPPNAVACTTWGSPRIGDFSFTKRFERVVPCTRHFIFSGDIISRLPIETDPLRYVTLSGWWRPGVEVLLDGTGNLLINPNPLEKFVNQRTISSMASHFRSSYAVALMAWIQRVHGDMYEFRWWKCVIASFLKHANKRLVAVAPEVRDRLLASVIVPGVYYQTRRQVSLRDMNVEVPNLLEQLLIMQQRSSSAANGVPSRSQSRATNPTPNGSNPSTPLASSSREKQVVTRAAFLRELAQALAQNDPVKFDKLVEGFSVVAERLETDDEEFVDALEEGVVAAAAMGGPRAGTSWDAQSTSERALLNEVASNAPEEDAAQQELNLV